jgi:EmrB/QacA subfamily drug resistance transporter
VLAVAVLGTFMAFVDATIVNIAIPDIASDLSVKSLSSVSWVLNAYNIVFAAFLVAGGQLADLLGRRRVFVLALLTFTVASALCAASPSLGLLVAARIIQAAGAALLVPSSLAIVLAAHGSGERMHAVSLWAAVAALAAGVGPPLGGLLITASNWRLVFLVNIPVGIAALVLAKRVLIESRSPGRRRMPDLLGAAVLALAIASLVLGIVKGEEWGWTSAEVLACFAGALALGAYFVYRAGHHRAPAVDLALLRIRAFALSNGVTVVMAGGFYGYTLCNVLFLTGVWRYSILQAGLALVPGPVTAMAVAPSASRLVGRMSHRAVVVPGALVWAAGMVFLATQAGVHPDFFGVWLPGLVILGLGAGLSFPTLSGAAVGSVPGSRFALATALNSVARQVGAAIGVAILIAILGTPSALDPLPPFRHAWLFAAGCFVFGGLMCLGLVVRQPREEAVSHDADGRLAAGDAAEQEWQSRLAELPSLAESNGDLPTVPVQSAAEFLLNVPVFAGLSAEMREQVATLAGTVALAPGEWLFRQGEPADAVYVVRVGHLEVLQADEDGPVPINSLTRGAVLGELALLSDSTRSASVRALRDSELLRIEKPAFEQLLRSEPELLFSLTRVLSSQLQASRPRPADKRPLPVTIAVRALSPDVPLLDLVDELSWAMCAWGRVAVIYPEQSGGTSEADSGGADAVARFAPLVERCEQDHDQVLLVCGDDEGAGAWDAFALARADRVLAVVDATREPTRPSGARPADLAGLRGADLLAYGTRPGTGTLAGWVELLDPAAVYSVATETRRGDVARTARRLTGRAVGVVLAGGGARAFAHLGMLETLHDAGLVVDRIAGVSMGAFIAGLLAYGYDGAAVDACCYDEWVRRNPINDYTIPRAALIRGHKAEAMLERLFGETRIEELACPFYSASANLRGGTLVIDRRGPLMLAVGTSLSLPLIAPPRRREEELLIDGSLLDNLPLEPMSGSGEGPVLALDIKGEGQARRQAPADGAAAQPAHASRRRLPSLPETMSRIALMSSANTDESARRYADMTLTVRVGGVGLLEFHQIDAAREAGREAARAALAAGVPGWLTDGAPPAPDIAGRRTVLRV